MLSNKTYLIAVMLLLSSVAGFVFVQSPSSELIERPISAQGPNSSNTSSTTTSGTTEEPCGWKTAESAPVQNAELSYNGESKTVYLSVTYATEIRTSSGSEKVSIISSENKSSGFTVLYEYNVSEMNYYMVDEDRFIVRTPFIRVGNDTACKTVFHPSNFDTIHTDANRDLSLSSTMIYYGNANVTAQRNINGQEFRFVITGDSVLGTESTLKEQVQEFRTASRYDWGADGNLRVNVFTVVSPPNNGLTQPTPKYGSTSIYVDASSDPDSPDNVFFHEYVHTRQEYTLEEDMHWFTEASATYYAALLEQRQNSEVDSEDALRSLESWSFPDSMLSRPDDWESQRVPYEKGSRVLATLDTKIRASSDSKLLTVFRWMNAQDDSVSYEEFRRKIVQITNDESIGEWLDSRVLEEGQEVDANEIPP